MTKAELQEELKQYRISVKNLSKEKKDILSELKRYKKAYGIVMDNFEKWDNETRQDVHEQLDKIDL